MCGRDDVFMNEKRTNGMTTSYRASGMGAPVFSLVQSYPTRNNCGWCLNPLSECTPKIDDLLSRRNNCCVLLVCPLPNNICLAVC